MNLEKYIATVEGFPKEGISFKDITPLMQNGEAFYEACKKIAEFTKKIGATVIVGPESRGFIFSAPVSYELKIPFIPVRKPGKLPREIITEDYDLEYGSNTLCMHADAVKPGDKVIIIDDLLATGGTIKATKKLVEKLGAEVIGAAFLIELVDLKGREYLKEIEIFSLLEF